MPVGFFKRMRTRRLSAFRSDQKGLALVEFAYVAPILLVLGMRRMITCQNIQCAIT